MPYPAGGFLLNSNEKGMMTAITCVFVGAVLAGLCALEPLLSLLTERNSI